MRGMFGGTTFASYRNLSCTLNIYVLVFFEISIMSFVFSRLMLQPTALSRGLHCAWLGSSLCRSATIQLYLSPAVVQE
jgi:hypothetical protein